MNCSFDTIIAGSGLAGTCAAFELSRHERVLLLDAGPPGSGASGISAGLVSPLMARRARPVWRMNDALRALESLLSETGTEHLKTRDGLIKPARDEEQAQEFEDAAGKWPEHGAWIEKNEARERWPDLNSPYGSLNVLKGGAVRVPSFLDGVLAGAQRLGAEYITGIRITGWKESHDRVVVDSTAGEFTAERFILSIGAGYLKFKELNLLHLHPIKGQWVRVTCPPELENMPPVSGRGYVVHDGEALVIGSTYEHTFTHLEPTGRAGQHLLEGASRMLPALTDSKPLDAGAAVRVTVPGVRLPMLGPLPERKRIWIFSGLGSKGLMLAPLLAKELPGYLSDPESIPKEISVTVSRGRR